MCKGQKGVRGKGGAGGAGGCLPGRGLPAQPDPTLHPLGPELWWWRCRFPCPGPPHPGPSKQHWRVLLGGMWGAGGPPALELWGPWCLCCWGAEEGAAGAKGSGAQPCSPLGNAGARTCNRTGTVRPAHGGPRGCSPVLPNTPKHLHLVSPQKRVLREHPGLAPVPKEPMDRHGLARAEEDRAGRESGGTAGQASGRAGEGRGRRGGAVLVPGGGLRGR